MNIFEEVKVINAWENLNRPSVQNLFVQIVLRQQNLVVMMSLDGDYWMIKSEATEPVEAWDWNCLNSIQPTIATDLIFLFFHCCWLNFVYRINEAHLFLLIDSHVSQRDGNKIPWNSLSYTFNISIIFQSVLRLKLVFVESKSQD